MERKNYPLTLEQLQAEVKKAIKKYGKDKYVLLSDDEEGNGYHECYFTFAPATQLTDGDIVWGLKTKDCVVLG